MSVSTEMSADLSTEPLSGTIALVTGASRGLGRGVAVALAQAGARVVGVARDQSRLADLREQLGDRFTPIAADAADPVVAGRLIDAHQPGVLVLVAGAAPLSRPLHQHTWQTFSRNWEVDVQQAFNWTREALLRPLPPGSTVISMSSGAARRGSPLSGGYAGAKATVAFISGYAAAESERAGLGIRFGTVLPQITPATELGAAAVAAYAQRAGTDLESYIRDLGPVVTPEITGQAITGLVIDSGQDGASDTGASPNLGSYLLTAAGLKPLD